MAASQGQALPPTGPSRVSLRDEQTELTRRRIVDAVIGILATNVADLNVEAVARASGVSRPTIYRYFRSKREMVEAVGTLYAEQLGIAEAGDAATLADLLAKVPGIFARYEQVTPELRAAAMRIGRLAEVDAHRAGRVDFARQLLEPNMAGIAPVDRERLAQIVTVLLSSGTQRSIRHYLDLSPDAAGELVVWTIRRLVGERDRGTK